MPQVRPYSTMEQGKKLKIVVDPQQIWPPRSGFLLFSKDWRKISEKFFWQHISVDDHKNIQLGSGSGRIMNWLVTYIRILNQDYGSKDPDLKEKITDKHCFFWGCPVDQYSRLVFRLSHSPCKPPHLTGGGAQNCRRLPYCSRELQRHIDFWITFYVIFLLSGMPMRRASCTSGSASVFSAMASELAAMKIRVTTFYQNISHM